MEDEMIVLQFRIQQHGPDAGIDFDRLRREDVTDGEEKLADSIEEMSKAFFELAGGTVEVIK